MRCGRRPCRYRSGSGLTERSRCASRAWLRLPLRVRVHHPGLSCYIMQGMSEPAVLARHNTEVFDLGGLNDAQRLAVEAIDGPVLVLAGAGTGKTRVLTTRLAFTIATGRAFPSELLAVTFTNKAPRERRERLEAMIGRAAEGVWPGTFQAVPARIPARLAEAIGLRPG